MRRRADLTDRQLDLLQRIAVGDDLAAADNGSKRSVAALHDRGLVVVRRSPWRAAITEVGQFYLKHGSYPDSIQAAASLLDQEARASSRLTATPSPYGATCQPSTSTTGRRPPPHISARVSAERRTAATELIDDLLANGPKVIKRPDEAVRAEWRRIVDYAKRNQLVPTSKRLESHCELVRPADLAGRRSARQQQTDRHAGRPNVV